MIDHDIGGGGECNGTLTWVLEYIVLHVSCNTMLWKLSRKWSKTLFDPKISTDNLEYI